MKHAIFGESHGPAIGVVLEGVPAGVELDLEEIAFEMARRAPGKDPLSTPRKEADQPEILSGFFQGHTTGTPLCALIRNTDTRSRDYEKTKDLARPGHGDWPGFMRYQGYNDYRGGGHFSGRLTAPLVFAGAVAKQVLAGEGIVILAHIKSIADVEDIPFSQCLLSSELGWELREKSFPVLEDQRGEQMRQAIVRAKEEGDSVGGVIECAVLGLPAGMGAPDYGENVEGIVSQQMFAIPGVKAIGFGDSFGIARLRGSEANDPLYVRGGMVVSPTNHSGGVNGGITNGLPLVFEVALRPTASISKQQDTIDMDLWQDSKLTIQGRHDPCIVHRAVPVVEAAAALAVCQLMGI